ncbi:MAG: hypothetical protein KBT75_01085 [Oleispira antarctica]|nr:hypothetical protein [Oleispira antarctica]MBQ0791671.1 hypothetical protein [Oleispira antarctica]
MIKSIVFLFFISIVILVISPTALLHAEYSEELFPQTLKKWKFVADKGMRDYSVLNIDAALWQPINVGELLPQKYNASVYGWYKTEFLVEASTVERPAIFIESIRGSDEVWLNDQLIGQKGKLHSPWELLTTQPQSLPRLYLIKKEWLKPDENTLIIKINTGIGHSWGAMFPGGTGITGKVVYGDKDDLTPLYYEKTNRIIALDMMFIILGLVDVFIILILLKKTIRPFPEFKWLLLGSCLMMLGAAGHDIFFVYELSIIPGGLSLFISLLFVPYVNGLYFWSQNKDVSVTIVSIISVVFLIITFTLLIPGVILSLKDILWQVWASFAALFFSYSLYSAIVRVRLNKIGSISQLIGVVIYIFSIRSQWIPFESYNHRNIQIGSLFFRYAILIAYFQQIFSMRLSYKVLSQKMLSISEMTRQEVARELHDNIGQYLASAKLQLGLVKKTQDPKHFQLLNNELDDALVGMRRTIAGLHYFPLENDGLRKTLLNYCLSLESKNNIQVNIDMNADNRFNHPVHSKQELNFHHNVFRVIQELAQNSIQHGHATELSIYFKCDKYYIMIVVQDNGCGFDHEKNLATSDTGGFGFISVKERIAILDGYLNIVSSVGQGTKADIRIPFY